MNTAAFEEYAEVTSSCNLPARTDEKRAHHASGILPVQKLFVKLLLILILILKLFGLAPVFPGAGCAVKKSESS